MRLIIINLFLFLISCGPPEQGQPGNNGVPCVITQTSTGATITCPGGSTATISNGQTGAQGPQGTPGIQGAPGVSPSPNPISIVQLCSSCTPSYPSTFPEVGICVNNQLYGVYSIPNAFMTLITPGEYSSEGINCQCNLSVGPNCQVTQN